MSKTHFMLDLETLGTQADAVILSIGVIAFDPLGEVNPDEAIQINVDIDPQVQHLNRHVSQDTLRWWSTQPHETFQSCLHQPCSPFTACTRLDKYMDDAERDPKNRIVWGNGSAFDNAIMAHFFRQFSVDLPWMFWNDRCFRTFKELFDPHRELQPVNNVPHNAMEDAIAQARWMCNIVQTHGLGGYL